MGIHFSPIIAGSLLGLRVPSWTKGVAEVQRQLCQRVQLGVHEEGECRGQDVDLGLQHGVH